MITVHDKTLNEFELMIVLEYLHQRGNLCADIYKGNDCIWVATGSANYPINEYFVFNNGRLVDIQTD